jgi:hypothetical protein
MYIETVERITDASARAIAGHTPEVEQPRIVGMRSRLVVTMGSTDYCE